MMEELVKGRAAFAGYMRSVLIGPMGGEREEIEGTPLLRYMMGMLFPRAAEVDIASDGTEQGENTADEDASESQSLSSARTLPSSIGLSFLTQATARLECSVDAAIYEREDGSRGKGRSSARWRRMPLGKDVRAITFPGNEPILVLGGRARLHFHARDWGDGLKLVTISLVNEVPPGGHLDPATILFQVGLAVRALEGEVLPYPEAMSSTASDREEREVRHLYRDSPTFARGHGVSAMWEAGAAPCRRVWADFMPTCEVRSATFEIGASGVLDPRYRDLDFLSFCEDSREVQSVLSGLAREFSLWIDAQEQAAHDVGLQDGVSLSSRCREWHRRMEAGISCLSDPTTFKAFRLANQAMLWQMQMAQASRQGPYKPMESRKVPALATGQGFKWRPFQVAFLLGTLESLAKPESTYRDVVDVIWFPTGGGKTEAYLLVAAFELLRRRLVNGGVDDATAVLSRYTLRMLTTQQFQRTGMLVCALELLRRRDESLGSTEFSLGLWVGQSLTPNKFSTAVEKSEGWDLANPGARNPFLLDQCPGCGTAIVDHRGGVAGVDARPNDFRFFCLSPECEFHPKIPMQVVDEALYREPPSILLGTLDKFAALTWDHSPSSFFKGASGGGIPPTLVIQDELHLISGPLGSISAPYEVAIDGVIRARNAGIGPKIVASTATIRNSREQVRGLYGRESTVFPSPINSWDDAFFFRLEDTATKPGRLYIGAMGQGTTTPVVAMVWCAAAMLQASAELALAESLTDPYWTVLAYLNSRRELGRTITAASQEIPDRIKAIASTDDRVRGISEVMELSSQMTKDMAEAIRTLQRKGTEDYPAVDFVPCTSIISVGVDVDRLGLMLVNGQPKLTSEYIQASSRVGRSASAPGIVVTLYSNAKPRDRSHYEDFLAYHETVYRHVEPTSVTPYAPPARERTLHSAIIALIRHASPFSRNEAAKAVAFGDESIRGLLARFKDTIAAADPSEADETRTAIDDFIDRWQELASSGGSLCYVSASRQFPPGLIRDYGEPEARGYYKAMRSVRSVDPDVDLMPIAEA